MLFSPDRSATALYVPPSRSPLLLRTAVAWERVGLRWAQPFAGVLAMTAVKQIYALPTAPAKARRRKPAYVPAPQALAAAERVVPPGHQTEKHQTPGRQAGGEVGRWSTNSACSLNRLFSQPLPK
jgi:hypothetical protein